MIMVIVVQSLHLPHWPIKDFTKLDYFMICEAVSNWLAPYTGSNIEDEISWLSIKNLQNF